MTQATSKAVVCTLFERDYHYGVGALVNSLYGRGFRGTIFAGYRGPLPHWASSISQKDGTSEFNFAPGGRIRFIPVSTRSHLTNHKQDFMLHLWGKHCPDVEAMFYFDPDITIKCRWSFFLEWVTAGVALCQDVNGWMADGHPKRWAWRQLLASQGIYLHNKFDVYFNCGFLGLHVSQKSFLQLWRKIMAVIQQSGTDLDSLGVGDHTSPFAGRDQDALNIVCMATEHRVSPLGQDGMDFQWGGHIMSHAIGPRKPWRRRFAWECIWDGHKPSLADKAFWRHTQKPIRLYTPAHRTFRELDVRLASLLARIL